MSFFPLPGISHSGNDGYTKLLLPMYPSFQDEAIGGVTRPHVMSQGDVNHPALINNTHTHFPGTALECPGTGGLAHYISSPASEDWHFGLDDWTVDYWGWFDATTLASGAGANPVGSGGLVGAPDGWSVSGQTNTLFITVISGHSTIGSYSGAGSPTASAWNHFMFGMHRASGGNTVYMALNGTQLTVTTVHDLGTAPIPASPNAIGIGNNGTVANSFWLQQFRISKGIVRWTSNFTPLDRPYG